MMTGYDSKFRMGCATRDAERYIFNSEVVIEPSPWPFKDVFVAGAVEAVLWLSWRHFFVFLGSGALFGHLQVRYLSKGFFIVALDDVVGPKAASRGKATPLSVFTSILSRCAN